MSSIALAAAALAVLAAALALAAPWLRHRRLRTRSTRRILFPVLGTDVSRSTLDAVLRIAQADSATLVPAYLATVPQKLSLDAPIPRECQSAMPLLETIERHAKRHDVPVDSRIERGRTLRHALTLLIGHERFDRIVLPARTSHSDGFEPGDIAWLLEHAPAEVVVLRPDARNGNGAPGAPLGPHRASG